MKAIYKIDNGDGNLVEAEARESADAPEALSSDYRLEAVLCSELNRIAKELDTIPATIEVLEERQTRLKCYKNVLEHALVGLSDDS